MANKYAALVHLAARRELDGDEREQLWMYAAWLSRGYPTVMNDINVARGHGAGKCGCDLCTQPTNAGQLTGKESR